MCLKSNKGVLLWYKGARDTEGALWIRNTYILICRELHAHAAQVPTVQMLPDSELADAALQDTELCCIGMATVAAVIAPPDSSAGDLGTLVLRQAPLSLNPEFPGKDKSMNRMGF